MKPVTPACRLPLAILVVTAIFPLSLVQAGEKNGSPQEAEDSPPPFETMMASALQNHPAVQSAQAKLERARLQVAKEVMSFRQQWVSALASLKSAERRVEQAEQDVQHLKNLEGVVSDARRLESERVAEASRQRVAQAQAKVEEFQAKLPLLLGTATALKADKPDAEGALDNGSSAAAAKLLEERLQLLREISNRQQQAYRAGQIGFDAVAESQLDLLEAQLQLAETDKERKTIRERMLQNATSLEQLMQEQFATGKATSIDVLKAKALRLRIEADLKR